MVNDKKLPLVSIVVITYNSANTVLETLESVKEQTYQNLELIITDDASKDNTVVICKKWVEENKNRFVRTEIVTVDENTGVSANVNRGMFRAQGEWIKGTAGDDLFVPDTIDEYIKFVYNHKEKVRMCVCDVEVFSNEGDVPDDTINAYKHYFEMENEPYELQRKRVMTELVFVGPGFFIKRDLFEEIGGYSEKYGNAEEWPFVYKIIMGGYRIYALDKKLVRYRVQASSLCHAKSDNGLLNKSVFDGMFRHFFDYAFGDLVRDGRPLTAWHYALFYWGRNAQYYISNNKIRKFINFAANALSPLVYLRKLGLVKEII